MVRPILEGFPDAHLWSIGGSDGAHSVRLDTLDEGQTRLLACAPSSPSQPGEVQSSYDSALMGILSSCAPDCCLF